PSNERTGADLGLDQNNLIYSGMATIRFTRNDVTISLGYQDYNIIREKRVLVVYGSTYRIDSMGVSNINGRITLTGRRQTSMSILALIAMLVLSKRDSMGEYLFNAKDIEAHIEIYR
ncbi:hypothetical protein B8A44_07880, partial [Dolosigranulum pigrum]